MRFLVDAQLPPALADWLVAREHVADRGPGSASDTEIWICATAIGAAIVTKDEDFAQRKAMNEGGLAVVWIRLPNTRRRDLVRERLSTHRTGAGAGRDTDRDRLKLRESAPKATDRRRRYWIGNRPTVVSSFH